MFNLCIYPLEKIQEADFFLLLLLCLRLLISLLNGSYWKGDDCLLGCRQLSNLLRRLHGKDKRWPSKPDGPKVLACPLTPGP